MQAEKIKTRAEIMKILNSLHASALDERMEAEKVVFVGDAIKEIIDIVLTDDFSVENSLKCEKELFTLVEPEPVIERRWIWLKDFEEITKVGYYISDDYAKDRNLISQGWYKSEMYIDVKVKKDKNDS